MSSCENCKNKEKHEHKPESIPYAAHELLTANMERQIKRLWIALLVCITLIFASNAAWLYAWCQYDYTSEEIIVEQDTTDGGNANYIGSDGDIINGFAESDYSTQETD